MEDFESTTQVLCEPVRRDPSAASRLMPLVYAELRSLAANKMRSERPDHSLQATELVHEAYLKLVRSPSMDYGDRAHFLAVAARTLRQILIDHARAKRSRKRGGDEVLCSLSGADPLAASGTDVVLLHDAIEVLWQRNERSARIADLRLFGGLNLAEIARLIGTSEDTVKRDWRFARAWLKTEFDPR